MRKIKFLLTLLIVLIGSIGFASAKTVYLKTNDAWTADGARFALYYFEEAQGGTVNGWADFVALGSILKAEVPAGDYDKMIVCRMNGGTTDNNWDNKWNQSADLNIPSNDNALYLCPNVCGDGAVFATSYFVGFDTSIATSSHDFKVAKGWGHIVGTNDYDGQGPYYMSYSYYQTSGVGGTGTLLANRQYAGDYGGGGIVNDILVTPAVNGTVTLDIKAYGLASSTNNAFVEVYAINNDGSLGDLLKTIKTEIPGYNTGNSTSWDTYELADLASEQKIGLRCQYVYIDNFTAEEVNIPIERTLTVTKVANLEGDEGTGGTTTYFEEQPDGTLKVQLKVTLQNTGDIDLNPGDDNYTLTVASATYTSGTKTYYNDASIAITEAIAAGATTDIDVDFYVPYTSGWKYWFVKENVSGTTSSSYRYAGTTAYEPDFVFRKAGSSSTSSLSSAEAWGTITESTTKNYEIFNNGTAPLIINSIAIPEGFTTDPAGTDVVLFRTSGYNADGAVWYAWTWNDGEEGTWVAEAEGKFTGLREKVNFIRMNPAGAPDWSKEWNRTGDLTVEPGKTYVIDSWGDTYEGKNYVNGHWAAAVVAKGATKAINITNDASVTGTFADDLVIKHLDKNAAEQTYTLGFSTTVIGLNTWTADFNNTTSTVVYPAGSVAESGIDKDYQYISSGNYNNWLIGRNTDSYATGNNKFITPKLHATAGEKLAFDVKAGYSGTDAYFVKVYVSTDRKTWGDPVETYVYSNTGSSFTTKTITFAEEGDYYVAFALYGSGSGIDNLVGLEKVDVAHDLYIKSVNWPDASVKSGTALSKPSVDIIPLTDETAESYTVKYIYGENEVAIASKALTASASSTTNFAASFTPEVASTTVFPATKVVFDFGGGVTFETDPFDLTVTNEAIFHFLNSVPTSKWYEPSDRTDPITYGKTNTADTQNFVIYNWGSAPLTVNSIALPEGFTSSVEFPQVVAAFDENNLSASALTLPITFSAATAGTFSGDMVITYSGDQTFSLPISGTKLDPTKWYANFNDQQWPAGSAYQSNVSISYINTGDYGLLSSSSTNNLFITPKLTAAANEVLQFDASTRNSYYNGTVKVYISNDRENLGDPVKVVELSKTDNVSKSTYEYQFAAAGDYYVAFAIEEARVDDIYGLTPVAVEHDWMVASSNIPTDAMQNVAKNASVNVLNLGLADEAADSYEVNLYIDGEKTATAATTLALPMTHQLSAAGTQITVPMQSPKAGTFPVYIEVKAKAGAYSIATEPVSVTFAKEEAKSEATAEVSGESYSIPLNLSYYNSESVSLFTSDILASSYGLSNGAKIKSITFKGYKTTEATTSTFNVWYEWTDDAAQTQPANGLYTTEGMTQIVTDQEKTWPKEGSSSNMVDFITLNFEEPLVYQSGKSLRIVMRSNSTQWKTAYFEQAVSSTNGLTYYHYNDTKSTFESNSWSSGRLPVMHIALEAEPKTYSGIVKDNSNNPIENATVTLVSVDGDNIQYTGTTNAAGEFSINVVQNTREYNATVTAYGYDDAADNNITFADNVAKNFELTPASEVSVTVTSAEWATITTPATYAVSFDENTEVYIATGEEGGNIKLTKIDDAPAMTPIVIHATAGAYTMTQKATATSDVSANILESAKGNEVGDGAGNYYVLGMTSTGVGFGKLASGVTLAKGKAYIPGTALANIADFLPFVIGDEDETTTINAVDAAGMDDDTPVYNLAGQKVGKDYKGVVIVNGRKVVRK